MKKLKLESLEVTSFVTESPAAAEAGTVFANAATRRNCTGLGCDTYTCPTTPDRDCTYGCTQAVCPSGLCVTAETCIVTELCVTDLDCSVGC